VTSAGDDNISAVASAPLAGHAMAPVSAALRDGLHRFVSRRVHPDQAEDLVQDILLRMHERAGELRDEARVARWAFRIAQRVVTDHYRATRPERALTEADEPVAGWDDSAGNLNELVAGWLGPMLALLPDEYAEALRLVDVEGVSQRDFAARSGLSISGGKSRVQRGRRMLEELLRACCDLELDAHGNVIGFQVRNGRCRCSG
jgi:RNA polymerase sigma-70 factor (ECF subfamily)